MGLDKVTLWNVPSRRNPFFTGREHILLYLRETPIADKGSAWTQPQVMSGPGGIGKTQIALEYAHRYRDEYRAVLWVNADSRERLTSDYANIAALLNLPEKDSQNLSIAVNATRRWLQTFVGWLLIFDNVCDMKMVRDFLPTGGRGHILMTTRSQVARSFALNIEIPGMGPVDEALFLLRRAGIIAPDAPPGTAPAPERLKAREIAEALHGLPLALELAGAYMKEVQCSQVSYLNLYKLEKARVLKRQAAPVPDCLESVATTLAISFEKVEHTNLVATDLLRLCAFLHDAAIPEEIFMGEASRPSSMLQPLVTDRFELSKHMRELHKYSLMHRDVNNSMLISHPLLQAALRESMSRETQRQWAERSIRAIEQTFPGVEPAMWRCCQRYLPHMQDCARWIEQWNMQFPEATRLLEQAGGYLRARLQYESAEPLLRLALTKREKLPGQDQLDLALSLESMASFYDEQGRYAQSEPLHERTLAMREKILAPDHPDVVASLNNLAVVYRDQGKCSQAEPLFQRALAMQKKVPGPDHPDVAATLNNLAILYRVQGKYTQAEPLFQRALAMRERTLEPGHPDVAQSHNALGGLYSAQGRYAQAEQHYQRALAIHEQVPGPGHPDLATTLNNLALLYHNTGKYAQAEAFYQRALAIYEQCLGPEHPYVASCLDNFAILYHDQGEYEHAEPLYLRALAVREKVLGPEHPYVAVSLNNLATLYTVQGKYVRAKELFKRALAICEQSLGSHHPNLAQFLENYAALLQKTKEIARALEVKARADAIWAEHAQENLRRPGR